MVLSDKCVIVLDSDGNSKEDWKKKINRKIVT